MIIFQSDVSVQANVDGAFFGTTFPQLLLMTYPGLRPQRQLERYVPRVFGFKLHASALALPEQQQQQHRPAVGANDANNALVARVSDLWGASFMFCRVPASSRHCLLIPLDLAFTYPNMLCHFLLQLQGGFYGEQNIMNRL